MKGLFRITLGLALVVALAACSSNDSIKRERDQARADAEMYMQQIESIKTALMAAGATGDTVDALVQSLADMVGTGTEIDVAALEAALREAGGEGADITALVNSIVAQLKMEQEEADKADMMAMMETARKLNAGISIPNATDTGDAGNRFAQHATATENAGDIEVGINDAANVFLEEDKGTAVADNHNWMGKRYTRTKPSADGMYEAVVYSNVGEPEEGDKFSEEYPDTAAFVTDGVVTIDTSGTDTPASRVASPSFDQSAGTKTFKLPRPNPSGVSIINIPGTFHGVAGTYSCTPGTNSCTATVAARGFTLGGVDSTGNAATVTWTFKPTDPNALVPSVNDTSYASYGWWIHKSADGKTFTASAFVDELGTDSPAASGITALRGTATYMGGAAGKYALYSSTGGTNDAGHFTAMATLNADFNADMISGTIDNFMGADGEARDGWSVELKKTAISDTGVIAGDGTADNTDLQQAVWTIDGTAASGTGTQWSGSLRENGDDNVPKVATGTFYSTYSTAGSMVGAFGANKQ